MKTRKNRVQIAISYGLTSANCLSVWLTNFWQEKNNVSSLLMLGGIFAFMVPISITDTRKNMTGMLAVCSSICLLFFVTLFLAVVYKYWWLFVCSVLETFILFLVALNKKRYRN